MAGVDKFGAAFAVAFMVAMIAFMGSLSPDEELPGISMPETSTLPPLLDTLLTDGSIDTTRVGSVIRISFFKHT